MLLQSLHRYAEQRELLDRLPFQVRTVHLLIPLAADGTPRGSGFVPLTTPVAVGQKTREEPGRDLLLPRFPGENNGGKAYYLADSFHCVFGLRKEFGERLPASDTGKDRNPVRAFRHFWQRIAEAAARTDDPRLKALNAFRDAHLSAETPGGAPFGWLNWRVSETSRADNPQPEWHGRMASGEWRPITKLMTVVFDIDGMPLVVPTEGWADDPVWQDWANVYRRESFTDDETGKGPGTGRDTVCLVTGATGLPVARSHKPKLLGVPGLASGGYIVSFAKESAAFSSFGFEMGANAPVSEAAAANYALGLNDLLANEDTHLSVGGTTFCFWAEKNPQMSGATARLVGTARPAAVKAFLKSPFAGVSREVAKADRFISVALSANAGRVVVRDWLRVSLDEAIDHLATWFTDLEIAALGTGRDDDDERSGPYSLFRLAVALVRESGELARMNDAIGALYRAAIQGVAPPVRLVGSVLSEFQSALVTDGPKKPKYPLNQSRFALLKLILLRNYEQGEFMPRVHLATDSENQAYNLGRLLAVLARLQKKAHDGKLEGPGIVQRYYAGAASSPSTTFPVLINLHHHHLRKLEQRGATGVSIANGFRAKVGDILKMLSQDGAKSPEFKTVFDLKDQGRFALGFYQQHAYERVASHVGHLLRLARNAATDKKPDEVKLCLSQAELAVTSNDYPDLCHRVQSTKHQLTKE